MNKTSNLTELQRKAENAARTLKTARTSLANATAAVARAEEAHSVAQKTFLAGVSQVTNATRVV